MHAAADTHLPQVKQQPCVLDVVRRLLRRVVQCRPCSRERNSGDEVGTRSIHGCVVLGCTELSKGVADNPSDNRADESADEEEQQLPDDLRRIMPKDVCRIHGEAQPRQELVEPIHHKPRVRVRHKASQEVATGAALIFSIPGAVHVAED